MPSTLRGMRRGTVASSVKAGLASLLLMMPIGLVLLCAAQPARARQVTVTITGKVAVGSSDVTGVFGPPNTDLSGKPFAAVYTLDDTQGVPESGNRPGCGNGRDSSGLSTPVPTAVLTINGKSYTFGKLAVSSISSEVSTENATVPQTRQIYMFREFFSQDKPVYGRNILWITIDFNSIFACRYWGNAFRYTLVPSKDVGGALWDIDNSHIVTDPKTGLSAWVRFQYAGGGLDVETVSVDGPAAGENLGCGCVGSPTTPENRPNSPANPQSPAATAGLDAGPKPNAFAGDAINTATGNVFETETDFTGAPATGLELTRSYNSQDATKGAFGTGWHSPWDRALDTTSAGFVRAAGADGRADTFALSGTSWNAYPDVTSVLTPVPATGIQTGWQLLTAADSTESYSLTGQFASVTTRAGLTTALSYDVAGHLKTVTGPFGARLAFVSNAAGFVTRMTAPDGGVFKYAYDANDNLISVTHPDGSVRKYVYGNAAFPHALTAIIDENGSTYASWTYDAQGRATSSEHAGGIDKTSVAYGASGTSTVTDARGNAHSYSLTTLYDVAKPVAVSGAPDPAAGGKAFAYDSSGFVLSVIDYDGNVTSYVHDSRGNLTARSEPGRSVSAQWSATFNLPTMIDEPGRVTTFAYDTRGNVLTKTVAAGSLTRSFSYTYNSAGQVLTATDPHGHVTHYTYDAKGNLATLTDALGHVTKFTGYDADGRLASVTDPNGLVTTLAHNFRGEVTARNVGGEITRYAYDRAGQLVKTIRPDGSFLIFTYDAAHRLAAIRDAAGERIAYSWDAASNLAKIQFVDPSGKVRRLRSFAYDNANRLAKAIGAAGETTLFAHDPNGNLTGVIDPLGHATAYAYDALNRLVMATDPNRGVTTATYDGLDHATSITDPRGLETGYAWNGLDEATRLISPDTGTTNRTFDAAGNVATSTDARRLTTAYKYDALNRPIAATYADGKTVTWQYDLGVNGIGHLTRMTDRSGNTAWTYDPHGRVLSKKQTTLGRTFTTLMSYDASGRLATLTYPSGAVVAFSYDAAGRVSGLKSGAIALVGSLAYQPFGPPSGWVQGNGAGYSRSYDQDGRVTAIGLGPGTMSFAYDKASRITGIAETGFPAKAFAYDTLDRLTGYTSGAVTLAYKYDADGNRVQLAAGATPTNYAIAATSNRLLETSGGATRTLSYDAAGNTTLDDRIVTMLSYSYDASGRLVAAKTGAFATTYTNNGRGERASRAGYGARSIPGGKEEFVYDEAGHLLGEYDGAGKAIEETVWLGDLPVAVLIPGKPPAYIAPDQLGAPHRIANAARAAIWHWDHDPFGKGAPTGTLTYNLRFPGQYFDSETGLYYNTFRDYDPTTGRYTESDPIGLQGGINTYLYAYADPLFVVDPLGMDAWAAFEHQFIDMANLSTGVLDSSTAGLTTYLHNGLGKNDFVDPCSFYYRFGSGLGTVIGYGKFAKGVWEIKFIGILSVVTIRNGQAWKFIHGSWGRETVSKWIQGAISGGEEIGEHGIEWTVEEFTGKEKCSCRGE